MVDVALVNCPPWDTSMPHLGIAYILSSLSKNNITTEFYDLNIDLFNYIKKIHKQYWNGYYIHEWGDKNLHEFIFTKYRAYIEKYLNSIRDSKPEFLCFSLNPANVKFSLKLIDKIRKTNKKVTIFCGGPAIRYNIPLLKKYAIDFFIQGEGEKVIIELITRKKNGETFSKLQYGDLSGRLIKAYPVNINELGFPTYEQFDLRKYTTKTMPIVASRGCFGKCNFCIDWIDNPYRSRDYKIIIEEIKYLTKIYGCPFFSFTDLVFNGNPSNIEKLCDKIISEKLKIGWTFQCIINKNLINLSEKLSKAGCTFICFGIESFSEKITRLMNKPYSYDAILPVFKKLREEGINIGINFIVGFPGERESTFNENIENFLKLKGYVNYVTGLNPAFVYGDADIGLHPEKYHIRIPKANGGLFWETKDKKNTFDIRIKRTERLLNLLWRYKIESSIPEMSLIRKKLQIKHKSPLLLLVPPFSERFKEKSLLIKNLEKRNYLEIFDFNEFLTKNCDNKLRKYLNQETSFWNKGDIDKELSSTNFFFCVERANAMIRKANYPIFSIVINRYNRPIVNGIIHTVRRFSNMPILLIDEEQSHNQKEEIKKHLKFNNLFYYRLNKTSLPGLKNAIKQLEKKVCRT